MKTLEPVMVLLEASGGLELPLVAALEPRRCRWSSVNPRQVRDFARATGKLDRSGRGGTGSLRRSYSRAPSARPETQVLNSMAARRHQVMTMLVSEKNRRAATTCPRIEAHIWLDREAWTLDEGLRQTLRQSPVWRE